MYFFSNREKDRMYLKKGRGVIRINKNSSGGILVSPM